jgi:hypothetical protein
MKGFVNWLIRLDGVVVAALLIVISQGFHYFSFFSSFELYGNWVNYLYSSFFTLVLSFPLMIFTIKAGNIRVKHGTELFKKIERKYNEAVLLYMWVDIVINIYTWYIQIELFTNFQYNLIPKYIVSTLIAVILPITLKYFAGEIRLSEKVSHKKKRFTYNKGRKN